VTLSQRGKEEAHDYRYLPEPDLPPLYVDPQWVEAIAADLPELPHHRRARFAQEYGLTHYTAGILTADRKVADFFERTLQATPDLPPTLVANWITGELFALLNEAGIELDASRITSDSLGRTLQLLEEGEINARGAKQVLAELFHQGGSPHEIVARRGLARVADPTLLDEIVSEVLQENPEQVQEYLRGKRPLRQWFFGQAMGKTRGRADPEVLQARLQEHLERLEENQEP
jgi:aspartyl-tRNA(Asn)/glutamyl-tRNA(Gln) amidotransferase subunit B